MGNSLAFPWFPSKLNIPRRIVDVTLGVCGVCEKDNRTQIRFSDCMRSGADCSLQKKDAL